MMQDTSGIDITRTYGALLLGGAAAFGASGVVAIQAIVYFKLFPEDGYRTKTMVTVVWLLDAIHSSFICAALFNYFITYWGEPERIDHITWSIALSVVVTAIQTFLVHCFFCAKILKSSRNNWYITGPIVLLALCRLLAATVSTTEMIRLHSFGAFVEKYPGWVFTTGLSLSSGVDIIITGWLCYFLRAFRTRMGFDSTLMIRVVDTLTLYTLENGALTCFTTTASLICWLAMPRNLVFLGLHFVIGKLYANSLLASLNTRNELRQMNTKNRPAWCIDGPGFNMQTYSTGLKSPESQEAPGLPKLEVSVIQTVERTSEDLYSSEKAYAHHRRTSEDVYTLDKAYVHHHRQPREPTLIQWRPHALDP